MTTPSAYARDATAALHKVLRITPGDFDADGAAAVIEKAIRHATRERDGRSRRQLSEVKATAQQRLARLLSSSPAVIYSFKASGDFAPTFVSDNIARCLATRRRSTWRIRRSGATGFTLMISPASRRQLPNFFTTGCNPSSTGSAAATARIVGSTMRSV
jgi:hypothetical protein